MPHVMFTRITLLALQAFLITGCAATSGSPPFTTASLPGTQAQSIVMQPDACDKTKSFGTSNRGGSFTLPTCAGWSGTITYPPKSQSHGRRWKVISSVSNTFGVPPPASGTAIFYVSMFILQAGFVESSETDTITSSMLDSSHTYSLMIYNFEDDIQCGSYPCPPWSASIGSPPPSSHTITFLSPLGRAATGVVPLVWQFIQN